MTAIANASLSISVQYGDPDTQPVGASTASPLLMADGCKLLHWLWWGCGLGASLQDEFGRRLAPLHMKTSSCLLDLQ